MGSRPFAVIAAVAAACLAAAGLASGRSTALPAGNLLQNPGAEAGACSPDGFQPVPIPNWSTAAVKPDGSRAGFTVICYGATNFPDAAVSAAINGGKNVFAGGDETIVSTASQKVDVSSAATEIDAGKVAARISADIGGFSNQADYGVVRVIFGDGAGKALGSIQIGPVTVAARAGKTALLARSTIGNLPPGTRSLVVTMIATRFSGSFDDGYFDNLDLELKPAIAQAKPALVLRCSGKTLVATVSPASGITSVTFSIGGKAKAIVHHSPFTARIASKGLPKRFVVKAFVTTTAAPITLTRSSSRC